MKKQRDTAHKYADGHDMQISKECKDEAISGTTDQRPGFQLMLAEVGQVKPGALIIWKTDRLGRDRYDLAIAKKQIRDAGCTIHYIAEPIAGDAPEPSLMEGVLESLYGQFPRKYSQKPGLYRRIPLWRRSHTRRYARYHLFGGV